MLLTLVWYSLWTWQSCSKETPEIETALIRTYLVLNINNTDILSRVIPDGTMESTGCCQGGQRGWRVETNCIGICDFYFRYERKPKREQGYCYPVRQRRWHSYIFYSTFDLSIFH